MCFKTLILNSDQILLYWGELEGETGILGKLENWAYFKSPPDLLIFEELEGEILENTWNGGIGMKLGGYNKQMSVIHD